MYEKIYNTINANSVLYRNILFQYWQRILEKNSSVLDVDTTTILEFSIVFFLTLGFYIARVLHSFRAYHCSP